MKKSLNELVGFPRFFLIDFLDPGVWDCSSTLSSSGAGVCAGVDAGTSAISAISSLSSDSKSKEAEASMSDLVRWTRSCDVFSAELCLTQFLVALGIAEFET